MSSESEYFMNHVDEYARGVRVRVTVQDTKDECVSFVFDGSEYKIEHVYLSEQWVTIVTEDRGTFRYAVDSVRELWTHDIIKVEEI